MTNNEIMGLTKMEKKEALRNILIRTEMKRIGENLSKKELCDIYGFNYNFYMNCIGGTNNPSMAMVDAMRSYLQTPTPVVYEMVFAHRSSPNFKGKTVKRNEHGKEEFHENLEISDEEYKEFIAKLTEQGFLTEPTAQYEQE
jgi:hypothetical protein